MNVIVSLFIENHPSMDKKSRRLLSFSLSSINWVSFCPLECYPYLPWRSPLSLPKCSYCQLLENCLQFSTTRNILPRNITLNGPFPLEGCSNNFFMKYLIRNDDINVQELEDELTYHYKDEDFESIETDFEDPINV